MEVEFDESVTQPAAPLSSWTKHYLVYRPSRVEKVLKKGRAMRVLDAPVRDRYERVLRAYVLDASNALLGSINSIVDDAISILMNTPIREHGRPSFDVKLRIAAAVAVWLVARFKGYNVTLEDVKNYLMSHSAYDRGFLQRISLKLSKHFPIKANTIMWNYILKVAEHVGCGDGRVIMKALSLAEKLKDRGVPSVRAALLSSYLIFNLEGYRLSLTELPKSMATRNPVDVVEVIVDVEYDENAPVEGFPDDRLITR